MMTRKDYIVIAAALKASQPVSTWSSAEKHAQYTSSVRTLASHLAVDNPRFDYQRFYAACGLVQREPGMNAESIHEPAGGRMSMPRAIDDRTPEQRQTHTLAWVGTDHFMSGWGEAAGLKSLAAWAFPLGKENQVERWVRARGDMARVRLVTLDGYRPARSNLHIYVVDAAHPAWRF